MAEADRVDVVVGGMAYEGWLQSEISRSIEAIAATFSIPVTLVPGSPPAIKRQDLVQVRVGGVVVATGYVLAAEPFYRRGECGMRIVGRDRTGDLVRCSAIHQGGQWRRARLDRIATDLVQPFDLKVVADVDLGDPIGDFKLEHGESVLDALSRAARLRGVLVTRNSAGDLVLTKAGQRRFAGVIRRGVNVIAMDGIGSDEARHRDYYVYGQSNVVADFETARGLKATASDAGISRHLPLIINAHGNTTATELQALADHTARIRRGHSQGFRYLVEGWTVDSQPWPVNERVVIVDDVAGLDGQEWLICSVRQTCDRNEGAVTELVVRPIEAYDSVPLRTKVVRRHWGNRGNTTNHSRGRDGALGGE